MFGRWLLTGIAVPLLVTTAWVIGHKLVPTYTCTATLSVEPVFVGVYSHGVGGSQRWNLCQRARNEVAVIKGRRVIDRAMRHEAFASLNRGLSPGAIARFTDAIEVTVPEGTSLIVIRARDRDPAAAQKMARALVDSYVMMRDDRADCGGSLINRLDQLEQRRNSLRNDLNSYERMIADTLGVDEEAWLERNYAAQLRRLDAIDREIDFVMVAAESDGDPSYVRLRSMRDEAGVTAAALAARVKRIADLRARMDHARQLLDATLERYDELMAAYSLEGRITVLSDGDPPLKAD